MMHLLFLYFSLLYAFKSFAAPIGELGVKAVIYFHLRGTLQPIKNEKARSGLLFHSSVDNFHWLTVSLGM